MLLTLEFGWIKFYRKKNSKYSPGFVWPADSDGIVRAQKVMSDGYPSNEKNEFFDYKHNIPNDAKLKSDVLALKEMNRKFNFSYI